MRRTPTETCWGMLFNPLPNISFFSFRKCVVWARLGPLALYESCKELYSPPIMFPFWQPPIPSIPSASFSPTNQHTSYLFPPHTFRYIHYLFICPLTSSTMWAENTLYKSPLFYFIFTTLLWGRLGKEWLAESHPMCFHSRSRIQIWVSKILIWQF